jgi:hypothetical protein
MRRFGLSVATVLVFAAPAVFLLWWAGGALSKDAAAAAGFTLAGAAVARTLDVLQERSREKAAIQERRHTDLDETRRIIYMVLIARRTRHPEPVATIANALAHHQQRVAFHEATTHLARVLDGNDPDGRSERWLEELVDRINRELDPEDERS